MYEVFEVLTETFTIRHSRSITSLICSNTFLYCLYREIPQLLAHTVKATDRT